MLSNCIICHDCCTVAYRYICCLVALTSWSCCMAMAPLLSSCPWVIGLLCGHMPLACLSVILPFALIATQYSDTAVARYCCRQHVCYSLSAWKIEQPNTNK